MEMIAPALPRKEVPGRIHERRRTADESVRLGPLRRGAVELLARQEAVEITAAGLVGEDPNQTHGRRRARQLLQLVAVEHVGFGQGVVHEGQRFLPPEGAPCPQHGHDRGDAAPAADEEQVVGFCLRAV